MPFHGFNRALRRAKGATIVGLLALGAFVSAQSAQPASKAAPVFVDGQAQVVPAFQDQTQWIRETLWVEAEFDSDGDGRRDRLHVDVTRQRQTGTEGLKVPVVYESSPYFAGTSGPRQYLWDVKQELGAESPPRQHQPEIQFRAVRQNVSNSQVNTWVPRGFAVVHSEAPGTGLSQGCPTVGGRPEEWAPKAVIDWLNGRAKGFKTIDGAEEIHATWSTGKVGMTGTSYNGTLPVAAATTGVAGLEAIIPIAPNTSYYHYYRSNGLVRHPGGWLGEDIDFLYDFVHSANPAGRETCNRLYRDGAFVEGRDRRSGDYNSFWAERDLLNKVNGIKAAVLMAHAFNDWNVVPEHSVRITEALKGRVPLQMYFHQGGHGGAPPLPMMNRWFTRYLYGVQNGVEKDAKAWIVREADQEALAATAAAAAAAAAAANPGQPPRRGGVPTAPPTPYADYPNPAASPVTLYLQPAPSTGAGQRGNARGSLSASRPSRRGATNVETIIDDVQFAGPALAMAETSPHRLIYATPALAAPVHISGFARVTIRMASSKPAANLSVWLVQLPWTDGPINTTNLITRGWADPQNHRQLTRGGNYASRDRGEPLVPGRFVSLTFDLQPDDQVIPAGRRIGLMIFSSDRDFTLWPAPGTELTIDLAGTTLQLPVVGGAAAVEKAILK
jgi:X-Pro dipeptidyl-peptidase